MHLYKKIRFAPSSSFFIFLFPRFHSLFLYIFLFCMQTNGINDSARSNPLSYSLSLSLHLYLSLPLSFTVSLSLFTSLYRFEALPSMPVPTKHGCEAFLVSYEKGTLRDIPGLDEIRSFQSFRYVQESLHFFSLSFI